MSAAVWAGDHLGRAFTGHTLEDDCPCPQAACGLIIQATIDPDCEQHAWTHAKSMRQSHTAGSCPAVEGGS